jgi:hypothetical protein
MDKVQKPSDSECYTSLSGSFKEKSNKQTERDEVRAE